MEPPIEAGLFEPEGLHEFVLEEKEENILNKDSSVEDVPAATLGEAIVPPVPEAEKTGLERILSRVTGTRVQEMLQSVPEFSDLLFEGFAEEIGEASRIIERYYAQGLESNLGRAEEDLAKCAAILVRLASPLGFVQGVSADWQEKKKLAMSGYYLELRTIRERDGINLTQGDADMACRVLASNVITHMGNALAAEKSLTNFWYALKDFIHILESQISRRFTEGRYDKMAEGGLRQAHRDPPTTLNKIEEDGLQL